MKSIFGVVFICLIVTAAWAMVHAAGDAEHNFKPVLGDLPMHFARRVIGLTFVLLMLNAGASSADNENIDKLIDRLVGVSEPGFGYSVDFSGSEFLPYEHTGQMETLVLGASRATPSAVLRRIVEKGADAVPSLLKHIGDARTIKTKPAGEMMWIDFPDEYDFNRRTRKTPPKEVNRENSIGNHKDHPHEHAITVGDLCFVALGQIVNRRYSATRYQPTAGLIVNSPTYSAALRKVVIADWSGLTKQRHKELLIEDFVNPDHEDRRIGAYLRLACYYPETVEPLVLKQLAAPCYDLMEVNAFVLEKLYRAKNATERNAFDAFIKKRGEVARQGILLDLFRDLDNQEADEEGLLHPSPKEKPQARACLVELFGYPKEVKSKDQPLLLPINNSAQVQFIVALTHDRRRQIGDAVKKLFLQRPEDDDLAPACLTCLANRGFEPFLIEQLSKIDLADSEGNNLHEKYIMAVSESREPAVQDKLLEIVKATANDRYFMAALPGVYRSHDDLVLKLACKLLANLPQDTDRGESLLQIVGERFPDRAKPVYKSFLAAGSAQRAETMCRVLWYGNPMSVELLAPLLNDKRSLSGFSIPMRVCDRAAEAISHAIEPIKFDSDWSTARKDEQIEAIKKYCKERSK